MRVPYLCMSKWTYLDILEMSWVVTGMRVLYARRLPDRCPKIWWYLLLDVATR